MKNSLSSLIDCECDFIVSLDQQPLRGTSLLNFTPCASIFLRLPFFSSNYFKTITKRSNLLKKLSVEQMNLDSIRSTFIVANRSIGLSLENLRFQFKLFILITVLVIYIFILIHDMLWSSCYLKINNNSCIFLIFIEIEVFVNFTSSNTEKK